MKAAQWPERLMTALGVMWLGLFPLLQGGSYSDITHDKWVAVLILTGLTVLATAAVLIWRRGRVRMGAVQLLLTAYFCLVAASALLGAYREALNDQGWPVVLMGTRRREGLLTQLCYCAIALCLSVQIPKMPAVLHGVSAGLAAFCLVMAFQYADINVLGLYPQGRSIRTNYEFQGTIGNIDMVAGYLSAAVPLVWGGYALERRPFWLISGALGTLAMLCTGVQCGLIALAVMMVALMLWSLHRASLRRGVMHLLSAALAMTALRLMLRLPWLDGGDAVRLVLSPAAWAWLGASALAAALAPMAGRTRAVLTARKTLLTGAMAASAVLLAVWAIPLPEGGGLWELQQLLHLKPQDSFGSERWGVWRLTWEMAREHPLIGHGPDTFMFAMDDYLLRTGQHLQQHFDAPHNLFLGVLAYNGLIAMAVFIALNILAMGRAARGASAEPALLPLTLALLCFLTQGMFTFSVPQTTPLYMALLGMTCAFLYNEKSTESV